MKEEVVYKHIEYNRSFGTLTISEDLLNYQALPPKKTQVKCSLALFHKIQVSPKSQARNCLKIITRSGKTAAFYVESREVLEELKEDVKRRIENMRQFRALQKQRQQQLAAQERRSRANPLNQLLDYYFPGQSSSSTAQKILQESDDTTTALQALQQKYAREIKFDPEINELKQQIYNLQTKLQHQQNQKNELYKQNVQLQIDQVHVNDQERKLKLLLGELVQEDAGMDDGSNRSNNTVFSNKKKSRKILYTKAIQKATANNKKPSPNMYNLSNNSSTNSSSPSKASRKTEKEALEIETNILKMMHYQMALQNQSSLAQKHTLIVKSMLTRNKTHLDNEYAEKLQFHMKLEGTLNALTDLYPDIVLRQDYILDKYLVQNSPYNKKRKSNGNSKSSLNTNGSTDGEEIPSLILSPGALKLKQEKRPSVTKSDGVSELGESLINGSSGKEQVREEYRPPATMTTVHSLQQSTIAAEKSIGELSDVAL